MYKIKIHYLFICLVFVLLCFGKTFLVVCTLLSSLLHELAHAYVAKKRGYIMENILLMPYGAVLMGGEQFTKKDSVVIAIAGPAVNLVVALILVALWWIWPVSYNYTLLIVEVNLSILVFNLLPVFPLDGSRIVLGLAKNKVFTLKVLRFVGVIVAFALMACFAISAFFKINFSLGVIGVFLAYGALSGTQKERYLHIASNLPFTKNYNQPIEKRTFYISKNIQLFKALKLIKPDTIATFKIVDGKSVVKSLDEEEFVKLASGSDITATFNKCLKL